jgi:hypothetical protein
MIVPDGSGSRLGSAKVGEPFTALAAAARASIMACTLL